jgi:uncharacterized GH25 family protein
VPERVWYQARYRLTDNTPVIVAGNRKGGAYCIFTDGSYFDGDRAAARAAEPGKTVTIARYFAKYSKLYLNPAASDRSFSTPLGTEMEIIPLDNPALLKQGSTARFRVLYNGKPLANTTVNATWDYYDYKSPDTYAHTGKTNAQGEVSFTINAKGLWIIQTDDTRKSSKPNLDEDNLAATLVFMVK